MANTALTMPITPEEIGVELPSSDLRRIDFSALDFESLRRMFVEYLRTYYPDDFNDFVLSNGTTMFSELVAAACNIISERSDIIADEAFIPTAQSRTAVSQHLELIGQEIGRATAAVVEIECSIPVPTTFDVSIPTKSLFNFNGPDGSVVTYELFRSPDDYTSNIIIPRGKRGVIALAVEGKFGSPVIQDSNGEANQYVDIIATNVLDRPIFTYIKSGTTTLEWKRVDFLEQANANDEVFEVLYLDDRTRIKFGDNKNGKIPIEGQQIEIQYRLGGGVRGRIGRGIININRSISQTGYVTQNITFRNTSPSRGGQDAESLDSARKRAPRQYSTHGNAATSSDYTILSTGFFHPAFGIVQKAVAVIRTGIDQDLDTIVKNIRSAETEAQAKTYLLGNYVNKNIIEIYILQEGEDAPVISNKGLKQALKTYLSNINVFTDELRILDGRLYPIDIDATVTVSRNVDPTIVKEQVQYAINKVFDISTREMGQALLKSTLVTAIKNVDGVLSVKVFKPDDDYPSVKTIITDDIVHPHSIGVNELVVKGNENIRFFLERGNSNI